MKDTFCCHDTDESCHEQLRVDEILRLHGNYYNKARIKTFSFEIFQTQINEIAMYFFGPLRQLRILLSFYFVPYHSAHSRCPTKIQAVQTYTGSL